MKRFSCIIFLMLLTVSCDNEEPNIQNLEPFIGTWELQSFIYQGDIAIAVPSEVTITFSDEVSPLTFNGYSSCNNYGGDVPKITTERISFSDIFSTEIGCSEEIGSFESFYYDTLGKINQYSFENDQLVLFYENTYLGFSKRTSN